MVESNHILPNRSEPTEKHDRGMQMTTFLPSAPLSPYIQKYLIIESDTDVVNTILPGDALVMAFRFRGNVFSRSHDCSVAIPISAISGLRQTNRQINYLKGSGNLLVLFKPLGAASFVREPLHELFEDTVPLGQLDHYTHIAILEDMLANKRTHRERVHIVERLLLDSLQFTKSDLLITTAIDRIKHSNGNIRIRNLADSLCISQDPFEKRFRRLAGVSPKQFAYIIKMNAVVKRTRQHHNLGDISFNAGYFDLPHFNKDFKRFTGQTPTQFMQSPVGW